MRVEQSYNGLPIWGASVTYEIFQDGSPSGAAEGHILADLRGEVSLYRAHQWVYTVYPSVGIYSELISGYLQYTDQQLIFCIAEYIL